MQKNTISFKNGNNIGFMTYTLVAGTLLNSMDCLYLFKFGKGLKESIP
jgi:hypothetical protein